MESYFEPDKKLRTVYGRITLLELTELLQLSTYKRIIVLRKILPRLRHSVLAPKARNPRIASNPLWRDRCRRRRPHHPHRNLYLRSRID